MKVIDFLRDSKVFYAATVDGDTPHVRPIGFVMEYNGELAFYSDTRKKFYKQMKANPKIEICAIDAKMNTLRIEGKVKFITDEASQKAAIEAFPPLGKMGYKAGAEEFQIYVLENPEARLTTMIGKPLDIEF